MKLKKILKRVLAGMVVAFVITCIAVNVYPAILLHQELASIRRQGQPLTSAGAFPLPVPPSQNAAPVYQRAAAVMKFKQPDNMGEFSEKKITAILEQNARTIQLIRQATGKPQCQFPFIVTDIFIDSSLPTFSQMRDLTRLMGLQARREARNGNSHAALQDVRRQFVMARQMANKPVLMFGLVAYSMQAIANRTLAKVLLQVPLTRAQARAFEASLPQIDWVTYFHQILLTERPLAMEEFQSFQKQLGYANFIMSPIVKMSEVYSLRMWKEIIDDESHAPFPAPSDYSEKMERRIDQIPWYAMFAETFLTGYTGTMRLSDYAETMRRQREVALALAVYHTKYHQYPAALGPVNILWGNAFPVDPYSKKSFRYKSDGKTFLLYSIGENCRDDGGARKYYYDPKKKNDIKDDIAWRH